MSDPDAKARRSRHKDEHQSLAPEPPRFPPRRKKKPFVLMALYVGTALQQIQGKPFVFNRYGTPEARDEALKNLVQKYQKLYRFWIH